MTELILIRHGETDWNRELRFQGHVDVPLNATGHEQARRLAARLAAEKLVVDHLVCSDLIRTRQTAQEPPSASEEFDEINHPDKLSLEATMINQNFSQQVLMDVEGVKKTVSLHSISLFFERHHAILSIYN